MRLCGLRPGERPVATDRALLDAEYSSSQPLNARHAIYRYAEQQRDLVGAVVALLPAGRILDAGCGPGRYLAPLSGRGIGSDLSRGMAAEASRFGPTVVADIQQLPFKDGAFDGALAAHMLYHVPDIGRASAELARVCRPGATVVVTTNGQDHLKELQTAMFFGSSVRRFTLENGAAQLEPHLQLGDMHRFQNRLRVPEPAPVLAYVDSLRPFYEPHLSVAWPVFLDRIRAKVEAEIASEGSWTATTDAGIMVCHAE